MNPVDSALVREVKQRSAHLKQFKASLDRFVQSMLDECEWSLIPGGGQNDLPLIVLRLNNRIELDDPLLIRLAEQVERYYGPADFALFSGETPEPLKVFSRTILDIRWRWRHQ
ncbi:MAG: hypothetical protein F6K19_01875 [Cyanothece sp. SIO1E1]|nr:hypothetical protein [Cyanothece sp. SIO1E1]